LLVLLCIVLGVPLLVLSNNDRVCFNDLPSEALQSLATLDDTGTFFADMKFTKSRKEKLFGLKMRVMKFNTNRHNSAPFIEFNRKTNEILAAKEGLVAVRIRCLSMLSSGLVVLWFSYIELIRRGERVEIGGIDVIGNCVLKVVSCLNSIDALLSGQAKVVLKSRESMCVDK